MNNGKRKKREKGSEDIELVKQFQSDDETAFDRLVVKHQNLVFTVCYRMLGDYDEANDCAQEVFIKIYNNLGKFKLKSSFTTWIYRIAVNTCKNRLSSSEYRVTRRMLRLDKSSNDEEDRRGREISDGSYNPETLYEKSEKEIEIQKAIDSLPPRQKSLVVLRDIEGKSYDEIVEITGIKLGTVKSKLARARHHLRNELKGIL